MVFLLENQAVVKNQEVLVSICRTVKRGKVERTKDMYAYVQVEGLKGVVKLKNAG